MSTDVSIAPPPGFYAAPSATAFGGVEETAHDTDFDPDYAFSSYAHIPPNDYARRRASSTLITGINLLWAAIKFYTAIGKLIEFPDIDYIRHYTNWSFTFQTLFEMAIVGAAFVQVGWIRHDSTLAFFYQLVFGLFYFPVLGIVITVRVLVWLLLASGATFLAKFMEKMAPAYVMLGDDAFHYTPVIELFVVGLVYRKMILYSLNTIVAHSRMLDSPARLAVFIFYQAFGLTFATLILFRLFFNPHVIYSTTLPDSLGFLVIFLTLALTVLLLILFVLWLLGVARRRAYSVEWLHRNDADPYVVAHYEFEHAKAR